MNYYIVKHESAEEQFVVEFEDGNAELSYFVEDGTIVFDHTYVPAKRRSSGVATAMAKAAVEFADYASYKIEAWCSFMKHYLDDTRYV